MYRLKLGIKKHPERRWALPDRVFFGHGACHILAGVYLSAPPLPGFYAERIIPGAGFSGNHIYVTDGEIAFDYHGYCGRSALLQHHASGWSKNSASGWKYVLERVGFDLLSTADLNKRKMRGPDQYWGDPIVRAETFIQKIDHTAKSVKVRINLRPE